MARALIARVKAADSSINRRDELWYASDSDALDRDWHVSTVCACADSLRMGDGPVTEWVARLEKPEQAYKAAGLRDNALRVVLEWLRSEWRQPEKQRSRRGGSKLDCSGLSSQEEQSRMGSSLPESRRGATLYSASWPRGRPPERSA